MREQCVIVGAGHGGSQAAASLRQEGYQGRIVLLSDEHDVPYHKPPLSKGFLKSPSTPVLVLRPEDFYRENGVDIIFGATVAAIERSSATVHLAGGTRIPYTNLILATGSRPRIPELDGIALEGVMSLRTLADARRMNEALANAKSVAIIGAGYIGMELAHTLTGLGRTVTLLEAAPRILARSVAPQMSAHVHARSVAAGIEIIMGAKVSSLKGSGGKVTHIRTDDSRTLAADLVIIATGAVPNVELAAAAGLATDNGIVIDDHMRSSDPSILAIGDCVSFHQRHAGLRLRLECVQNATDQARNAAKTLVGRPETYQELPWFWSDQGDMKLQSAGLAFNADHLITTGSPPDNAFAIYHFRKGRLIAVDTLNRPGDHMMARRLIAAGKSPSHDDVLAGTQRLKELMLQAAS